MVESAMRSVGVSVAAALLVVVTAGDSLAGKVSLSEVAEQAAKPSNEQKVLGRDEPSQTKYKKEAPTATAPETEYASSGSVGWLDIGVEIWGVLTDGSEPAEVEVVEYAPVVEPPVPTYFRVGVTAGGGGLAFDTFGPTGTGGLLLGFEKGSMGLDLRGHYAQGQFPEELRASFHTLEGWAADAVLRWRVLRSYSGKSLSLMFAGRLGNYEWDFQNPVHVARGHGVQAVARDSISYRTVLGGISFEALRSDQWSLQFTPAAGYQWFNATTDVGFENDVFHDGVVVEGRVEVVFTPRW